VKKKFVASAALLLPLFLLTAPAAAVEKPAEASVVVTEAVPFITRVVEDAGLPAGVEVVTQVGAPGELTRFSAEEEVKDAQGSLIKVPRLHEEITKVPVEQVIRRGTNAAVISGVSEKTRALEAEKAAREAEAAAEAARKSAPPAAPRSSAPLPQLPNGGGSVTSPEENRSYAQSIMSAEDFACFNTIAMRESGWRTDASNPSSGAYGVPQALPGSKMASAGADWQTNGRTQVNWMVSYINGRYGTPCGAVDFWDRNHWY
jgi:hypothetical protein